MTNTKYSEFNSGTMDATSGGGTANTSGTLGFSPFSVGFVLLNV